MAASGAPGEGTGAHLYETCFAAFTIFSTDGNKVYYSSDEEADIPNIRSLDLQTGVIQQYTDVLGGNMAPAPLKGGKQGDRLAFISYFKNEYKLQTSQFCPQANAANRNAITKTFDLFDTPWTPCR